MIPPADRGHWNSAGVLDFQSAVGLHAMIRPSRSMSPSSVVISREQSSGDRPFGVAVAGLFEAGRTYRVSGDIAASSATSSIRIEVHGFLVRSAGAHITLEMHDQDVTSGSEVRNLEVHWDVGGTSATCVRFSFELTVMRSARRHVYVFADAGEEVTVSRLTAQAVDGAPLWTPYTRVIDSPVPGVHAALHEWYRVDNYLHVRMSYHREGATLVDIWVRSHSPIAAATVIGQRRESRGHPRRWRKERGNPKARDDAWFQPAWEQALVESPELEPIFGPDAGYLGYRIDVLTRDVAEEHALEAEGFMDRQMIELCVQHSDGSTVTLKVADLAAASIEGAVAPGSDLLMDALASNPRARVLELGGNGPQSAALRSRVAEQFPDCSIVSIDINEGPLVDVVGDAQHLDRYFARETFDIVYSAAVLEHVGSLELVPVGVNHVLVHGGTVISVAPLSFPLHAEPADFWRLSDHGLGTIFGPSFGFRVDSAGVLEPCRIIPRMARDGWGHPSLQAQPAFLGSFCISTKVTDVDPEVLAGRKQAPYDRTAYAASWGPDSQS